ncbi:hypothetical protein [Alkalibacter saccharofermentans]|uniref:PTS system, galactitol-specific IIB component n=1 Tax=Alkalibacter saccharofermentans DSM 14828 TaxID=1120975 RepID=A0A1M4U259_9FIRM|nr:hypothetical protein [Alkalibacter saccharofermentans]SHE50822.1 PTS system, galactitol-specific IIB component [Alkalibacter saccharofermentans DSM 14828]
MAKKRIIVVCGAGFATSTAGEDEVKKIVKELKIEAEILKKRVVELKTATSMGGADLYVLMTPTTVKLNGPSVNGVAFISGVGKQEVIEQIKQILSE